MSDDKKKKDVDSGKQSSSKHTQSTESVDLKKHEAEKQRQKDEWSKIEKRGTGAGDRPKR